MRSKQIMAWIGLVLGVPLMVYALSMIVDGGMGQQRWTDGSWIALASMGVPLSNEQPARGTVYAITDRRVLIIRRRFRRTTDVQSIPTAMLRVKLEPGSGDIELVPSTAIDDEDREDKFRLLTLRDVRATEAALRQLIQSSSKSSYYGLHPQRPYGSAARRVSRREDRPTSLIVRRASIYWSRTPCYRNGGSSRRRRT